MATDFRTGSRPVISVQITCRFYPFGPEVYRHVGVPHHAPCLCIRVRIIRSAVPFLCGVKEFNYSESTLVGFLGHGDSRNDIVRLPGLLFSCFCVSEGCVDSVGGHK